MKTRKTYASQNNGQPEDILGKGISREDAHTFIGNFKKHFNQQEPSGGFISRKILDEFSAIPNFQGINVYCGLDKTGMPVLIFIGVTKIGGKLHHVFNYTFSINNEEFMELKAIDAPIYVMSKPPCPPLPPNCNTCGCS